MHGLNVQNSSSADWLRIVQEKVRGLRYGEIQITIHDARVVAIECTEKTRLDQHATPLASFAHRTNV